MPGMVSLAAFWFLYFCGLGIFAPFFPLYLRENAGLSGTQVGIVLAVLPLVGILAQPLWGQVADRTGRRVRVLAQLTVATSLTCAALTWMRGFPQLAVATAGMGAFATAVVPMSLSVTFAALRGRGPHAFGLIRVWGTIGYLVCVAGYPWLLHLRAPADAAGGEPGLDSIFYATAACIGAAALVGPWLPRDADIVRRAAPRQWRALLRQPAVLRLLAFNLLGFFFLAGPMGMFPIFIRARGGDLTTIGHMWVVMLLLEIPLVVLAGSGVQRFGARGLLAVGVLAGGVRWTLCGLSDSLPVIYAVQLLHGVVVTGLLLGGPLYLEQIVPDELRATGQGLLAMVGSGLGGIGSNLAAGWLLEHGGPDAPFLAGGAGALLLGMALRVILPAPPCETTDSRNQRAEGVEGRMPDAEIRRP